MQFTISRARVNEGDLKAGNDGNSELSNRRPAYIEQVIYKSEISARKHEHWGSDNLTYSPSSLALSGANGVLRTIQRINVGPTRADA
jgi:hypothetical protein